MMSTIFVLLAKGAFADIMEGVNSKKFSLSPLASSRPPSFHKHSVINLRFITFKLSHTSRETTSFYPQLRYFHFCTGIRNTVGNFCLN